MSSTRYEQSLRIEPQPSTILKWFLIVNFSGATLILPIVFDWLVASPIAMLLWLYFYRLYSHYVLQRTSKSIRLLVRETTGEWLLHTRDGIEREVTLSPSSYIYPQLIILILLAEGKHFTLPLLRDSLSEECFRALSVRLKVQKSATQ